MVFTVHYWHHASREDLKPYSMTLSGLTMRPLSSDGGDLMTATIIGLSGLLRGGLLEEVNVEVAFEVRPRTGRTPLGLAP